MRGINKAILVGSLGADPECRATSTGETVATISLATNEEWKDKQGLKQSKTEWHRVVFFGKLAEIVRDYLKKGSSCYVEGKIQTRKWQADDGTDRYTTEIVGREMQMLGGSSKDDNSKSHDSSTHNRDVSKQTTDEWLADYNAPF